MDSDGEQKRPTSGGSTKYAWRRHAKSPESVGREAELLRTDGIVEGSCGRLTVYRGETSLCSVA